MGREGIVVSAVFDAVRQNFNRPRSLGDFRLRGRAPATAAVQLTGVGSTLTTLTLTGGREL